MLSTKEMRKTGSFHCLFELTGTKNHITSYTASKVFGNVVLFMSENSSSERRILLAFALNLFFAVLEVFVGLFTGSVMIFSDAIHDFGDCFVLGISWKMERISGRPADEKYPFGYRRYSVLAGMVNCLILLIGGTIMIVTAVERFLEPREINGLGMLIFAGFGIIINGAAVLVTSKGNNINEKSISTHMLEDVLTWIAVLVVGCVLCFWNVPALDSILAIAMTMIIFIGVMKNLYRIFPVLLMRVPVKEKELEELKKAVRELYGEDAQVQIRCFSMDGESHYAAVLLTLSEWPLWEEQEEKNEKVRDMFCRYGITDVSIQIERC